MKGTNTYTFNGATMCEIVQHYFNTVLFKEGVAPVVNDVAPVNHNGTTAFAIKAESIPTGPADVT